MFSLVITQPALYEPASITHDICTTPHNVPVLPDGLGEYEPMLTYIEFHWRVNDATRATKEPSEITCCGQYEFFISIGNGYIDEMDKRQILNAVCCDWFDYIILVKYHITSQINIFLQSERWRNIW